MHSHAPAPSTHAQPTPQTTPPSQVLEVVERVGISVFAGADGVLAERLAPLCDRVFLFDAALAADPPPAAPRAARTEGDALVRVKVRSYRGVESLGLRVGDEGVRCGVLRDADHVDEAAGYVLVRGKVPAALQTVYTPHSTLHSLLYTPHNVHSNKRRPRFRPRNPATLPVLVGHTAGRGGGGRESAWQFCAKWTQAVASDDAPCAVSCCRAGVG